jgi:hypothetical protein
MSAIYPIALMLTTGCVWFLTVWQNSRLVELFWQRLPRAAQQELPGAMDRHLGKTVFFFRRRAVQILRGDAVLWRQRQYFLFLAALSVLVPILGFLSIVALAYFESRK